MKIIIKKEALRDVSEANQNRKKGNKTKKLRKPVNERAGVSQQTDDLAEPPHQAQRSAENL